MQKIEYGVLQVKDVVDPLSGSGSGSGSDELPVVQDSSGNSWTTLNNVQFTCSKGVTEFGPVLFEPLGTRHVKVGSGEATRFLELEDFPLPTSLLAAFLGVFNQLAAEGWEIQHIDVEREAITKTEKFWSTSRTFPVRLTILFQRSLAVQS